MPKATIPKDDMITNPLTEALIKVGGKTFKKLVKDNILHEDGKVKANASRISEKKKENGEANKARADKRRIQVHGSLDERFGIFLNDIKTPEQALALFAKMRDFITEKFDAEVNTLAGIVGSLNLKSS